MPTIRKGADDAATEAAIARGPQLPDVSAGAAAFVTSLAASRTGSAAAESVIPVTSAGRDTTPYPAVDPAAAFQLVFDPNRWTVMCGRIVPELRKLSHIPGVDGVDRGEDGQAEVGIAIAQIEARGGRMIPFEIDGPGTSYLVRIQVGTAKVKKTGAIVPLYSYHTRWETLWPGSGEIGSDGDGYSAWLRGLVDRGYLPEPRPYVLDRLLSLIEGRVGMWRVKAAATPDHPMRARYETDYAAVLAHKAALGLGPPAAAEPVTVPA